MCKKHVLNELPDVLFSFRTYELVCSVLGFDLQPDFLCFPMVVSRFLQMSYDFLWFSKDFFKCPMLFYGFLMISYGYKLLGSKAKG